MRRIRQLATVTLLLVPLVPLTTAAAQQLSEVAPGARVRLRAPGVVAGRYSGTVLSRTADTLVVARTGGAPVRVPVSSLTSVEVSRGESRLMGAGKGALWGGAIGLGIGFLAAAAGEEDDFDGDSDGEVVIGSALGGAIWGVIIGAIVGSERWDRYDLPTRTSLVLPVQPGRFGLGLRVAVGH
jgi:hypothetical protein